MAEPRRIALVTGANRGIGRETARQLAVRGMTVLLGARDEARGKEAAEALSADGDVRFLPVDVTDSDQVARAAELIAREFGHLDVLINNAGIIAERGRAAATADVDEVRATYEVNVFGVIRVTNALLPLLLRSPAPRIVNLSSFLGSLDWNSAHPPGPGLPVLLGYATSKTALNALTVQYARELREYPIKINSADPGHVATELNGHTGVRTVEQGAAVVVDLATLPADGPTGEFHGESGPVRW